jgi:hypothetical protein
MDRESLVSARFGGAGRVVGVAVAQQGLREPGADVGLAANPGRAQVVDGQSGGDRGQVRLLVVYRLIVSRLVFRLVVRRPEEGFLHDVLGVADAAGHPVGDREHQRPVLGVIAGVHVASLRRHLVL